VSQLSRYLREAVSNGHTVLLFWCPGCNRGHSVYLAGPIKWDWNGSAESPTFSPSVLVEGATLTDEGYRQWEAWHAAGRPMPAPEFEHVNTKCHSFVRNGQIEFLHDSTHQYRGQTVELGTWPQWQERMNDPS
jgi:hypothetical protein